MDRNERLQQLIRSNRLRELKADLSSWNPDRLFTDDAVNFLEEVPANVVLRALRSVDKDTRERITRFLNYPKNSAGSLMTAEFIELHDRLTAREALDVVRREGSRL